MYCIYVHTVYMYMYNNKYNNKNKSCFLPAHPLRNRPHPPPVLTNKLSIDSKYL